MCNHILLNFGHSCEPNVLVKCNNMWLNVFKNVHFWFVV